jgi:vacuolar-type H+-ATPase subunit I/STV1
MFWYGLTGFVLVGGIYFFGGWVMEGNNNVTDWVSWMRGYTETNDYWRQLSWKTPVLASMGFLRTIIGGQFVFNVGATLSSMETFLKMHALQDEAFLVRDLSPGLVWTALILSALVGVIMMLMVVQFIARFRAHMRNWRHIIIPLLLYAAIYSAYFFFWMPEILEFWFGQCIVFWWLMLGTRPAGRPLNILAGILALLLFVINYTTSIRLMQDLNNDIGYARVQKVRQAAAPGDLVVVQNPWLLKEFLEYYTHAPVRTIPEQGFQQIALRQYIDSTVNNGHRVFIFPSGDSANGFIPALKKDYAPRMHVFQQELAPVWEIR